MPATIDQNLCINAPRCFAAPVCPQNAIAFRVELGQVMIESDLCGDCPGPCTNFCDPAAIKYAPTYEELDLLIAQIEGRMTADEVAVERKRLKEEAKQAEEAAKASPVVTLTAATFEQQVRAATLPIVIDFWADWCGPCKQMAPVFEKLAQQYQGKMIFAKIDTDKEQALAQRLGIRSLPTLLFIYQGQVIDGVVGAVPAPQLQARINQVISAIQQLEARMGPSAGVPAPGDQPGGAPSRGAGAPGQQRPAPNGGQPSRPKLILP